MGQQMSGINACCYLYEFPSHQYGIKGKLNSGLVIWRNRGVPFNELVEYRMILNNEEQLKEVSELFLFRYQHRFLVACLFLSCEQVGIKGCGGSYQGSIYYQQTITSLSQINDIPFKDTLHMYAVALRGFHILYKKFGYFDIYEDMFHICETGRLKVWCNSVPYKLTPEPYLLDPNGCEEDMVRRILHILDDNSDHKDQKSVRGSLNHKMRVIDHSSNVSWGFEETIGIFRMVCRENNWEPPERSQCLASFTREQIDKLLIKQNFPGSPDPQNVQQLITLNEQQRTLRRGGAWNQQKPNLDSVKSILLHQFPSQEGVVLDATKHHHDKVENSLALSSSRQKDNYYHTMNRVKSTNYLRPLRNSGVAQIGHACMSQSPHQQSQQLHCRPPLPQTVSNTGSSPEPYRKHNKANTIPHRHQFLPGQSAIDRPLTTINYNSPSHNNVSNPFPKPGIEPIDYHHSSGTIAQLNPQHSKMEIKSTTTHQQQHLLPQETLGASTATPPPAHRLPQRAQLPYKQWKPTPTHLEPPARRSSFPKLGIIEIQPKFGSNLKHQLLETQTEKPSGMLAEAAGRKLAQQSGFQEIKSQKYKITHPFHYNQIIKQKTEQYTDPNSLHLLSNKGQAGFKPRGGSNDLSGQKQLLGTMPRGASPVNSSNQYIGEHRINQGLLFPSTNHRLNKYPKPQQNKLQRINPKTSD